LIDEHGKNLGVFPLEEALRKAWDSGFDLVEVDPVSQPPVCKVMDFGKLRYEQSKKRAQSKPSGELKEIGVSLKISKHDLEFKIKQAKKFLEKGHKVKFNLPLRGREKSFQDTKAVEIIDEIIRLMSDDGVVETKSKGMIGNRLFVIISPSRKKTKKVGAQDKGGKETKIEDAQGDRQKG